MPQRAGLRWLLVPLGAVGIAAGFDLARSPSSPAPLAAADWRPAGHGPATYSAALRGLSDQLDLGLERVAHDPHDWLRGESLARAYMARSRFAVGYDDLAKADGVLDDARAKAPGNSGPLLSMAVLGMMSHRLAETEAALDLIDTWAVPPEPDEQVEIMGLRGDLAFYRGDMTMAELWYGKGATLGPGPAMAFRRANLAKARGDLGAAKAIFLRSSISARQKTPFQHASTALQIGAVAQAQGNHAEARDWFAVADRQFPGFWLFEAHRAQSHAIAGDLPRGIEAMRAVARKSGSAEVMDALAMLLRYSGQAEESREWAARAGGEWDRRLALAPEAAYGHALEHEIVFGTPGRALDLARRNLAARPYGESRVLLATALTMNSRYAAALAELDRAEASGWRSAPLYALKAQIFELTGQGAKAGETREKALALNPRIFAPETALVWFSHG
jgi:tetratricopeptide (TPR) repeat protein